MNHEAHNITRCMCVQWSPAAMNRLKVKYNNINRIWTVAVADSKAMSVQYFIFFRLQAITVFECHRVARTIEKNQARPATQHTHTACRLYTVQYKTCAKRK